MKFHSSRELHFLFVFNIQKSSVISFFVFKRVWNTHSYIELEIVTSVHADIDININKDSKAKLEINLPGCKDYGNSYTPISKREKHKIQK